MKNETQKRIIYSDAPFQKIPDAARYSGFSQFYIRQGIKNGTIPYERSGQTYYVNMLRLMEKLNALPAAN